MSTLSPKGQSLVRAGRRAYQPTQEDRARLVTQLRSHLGDAALPAETSATTTAATVSASGSAWPLISAVVVGVGILGGALYHVWPGGPASAPVQQTGAPSVTVPQPVQADEPAAVPDQAPSAREEEQPAVAPPPASSPARPKDRLAAEVAILSHATRELRAGHPANALKALDEYRRAFPKGMLKDEQRAARAQALCALNRYDEAEAKLAELPRHSPLAVRANQFCDARKAAR
jgi:type IV secretory pathway VirB10-like protein